MPDTTVSAELQGKDGATVRTVEIGGANGDFGVNKTGAAKEATLAAILAALTDGDEAASLAKLEAIRAAVDGLEANTTGLATQTTLAALLTELGQKLEPADLAALATSAKQDAQTTALGTDGAAPPSIPGTGVRGWLRSIFDRLGAAPAQEHSTAASPGSTRLSDGAAYIGSTAQRLHVDDGGSALSVDDGGGSLTVDGAVVADTELPAPAALSDSAPNPAAPAVGAGNLLFNGTTWDRARGDIASGLDVDVTRLPGTVAADVQQSAEAARGTLRTDKRYDIRPDAIYLATAALGSADAQSVWTIKRVTLALGSPTHTHWSAAGVKWSDRETTAYT